MRKTERQEIILKIIRENVAKTQDDLQKHLKEYGIEATQATVSRDLHELKIVKIRDDYGRSRYVNLSADVGDAWQRLKSSLKTVTVSIDVVQFMVIIHTSPSYGNMLTTALDDLRGDKNLDYLGTIAGHDTVAIFCSNEDCAQNLGNYLKSLSK